MTARCYVSETRRVNTTFLEAADGDDVDDDDEYLRDDGPVPVRVGHGARGGSSGGRPRALRQVR